MAPRTKLKCSTKSCRKAAVKNGLCAKHAPQEPATEYAIDSVMRVTELEVAQFTAKDAEIRNALLSAKNLELEIEKAERTFTDLGLRHKFEQDKRRAQLDALKKNGDMQRGAYTTFVTELAQKYHLDPQHISIDTESRVIRDLRDGNQS